MLMLELGGRLGNQMFQYAAVRTLAEERGLAFACAYNGRFQPPESRLESCFRLDGDRELHGPEVLRAWDEASRRSQRRFSPCRESRSEGILREVFDSSFWDLEDGTYIRGGFQCPRYFAGRRESVLSWYTPHERFLTQLRQIEAGWPAPPDRRCCVAIRRGDYATLDKGLAHGDQGWMLPASYYREALRQLPKDLFFVFVSDDPGFVRETFAHVEAKYVSENQPPAVQMFLLTLCRYNVIANSSFSWWGAWCNQTPGKEVIAPRYHLGWAKRIWHPGGMEDTPPEWRTIDVLETLEP